MGAHEWLWQALHAGQHQLVRNLAPTSFDWKSVHEVFGTPLMALVHTMILADAEFSNLDDLVRWCMRMGADPRAIAPNAQGFSVGRIPPPPPGLGWTKYADGPALWWYYEGQLGRFWCESEEPTRVIEYADADQDHGPPAPRRPFRDSGLVATCHRGHSAISLAIAIRQKLLADERAHAALIRRADFLLGLFAEFEAQQFGPRVQVAERVVQIWAAALDDEARADVELVPVDDSEVPVRAHSLLLRCASPVLKASLDSTMQEGITKRIRVHGASTAALRHVLVMMYTGCSEGDELPVEVQLDALDLAHRWQVEHVVTALDLVLARRLGQELRGQPLERQERLLDELLTAAVLKSMPRLRTACHAYACNSPSLRHSLQAGALGSVAASDLQRALGGQEPSTRETKRLRAL